MPTSFNPVLWTGQLLLEALGKAAILHRGSPDVPVTAVKYAANAPVPATLLLPYAYSRDDRAEKCQAVLDAGPSIVLAPAGSALEARDGLVIEVKDLDVAMRRIAARARQRFQGKVVGITGSVGKTTTKDLLAHVLSQVGPTHFNPANVNRVRALRTIMAGLPRQADYAVLELAMVQVGDVARKCRIVRPDIGIVTSIGHSHGQYHGDEDATFAGKMQLAQGLVGDGVIVLPSGSRHFQQMKAAAALSQSVHRIITAGRGDADHVRLVGLRLRPGCSEVEVALGRKRFAYTLGQPGEHLVMNSLLVVAALEVLGVGMKWVAHAFSTYRPTARRFERFALGTGDGGTIELIDDSYNAAPDSVGALLAYVAPRSVGGRKVLALGDMLELGAKQDELHAGLAPLVRDAGADLLVTVGPQMARMAALAGGKLVHRAFGTADEAATFLRGEVRSGDLVAVKGSNAMQMGRVVSALKQDAAGVEAAARDWAV